MALQRKLRTFSGVQSAYLFGSHARGTSHRESDVDIGVLLSRDLFPSKKARFDQRLLMMTQLQDVTEGRTVDLIILNEAPPGLGRHVVIDGKRIYCPDPAADHDYVRDIQLRAADLKPFLERMRRLKLEALGKR